MKIVITIEDEGDTVTVKSKGTEGATPEEIQQSCAAQLYAVVATVLRSELQGALIRDGEKEIGEQPCTIQHN